MNNKRAAVGVKEGCRSRRQRDKIGSGVKMADASLINGQVGQVTCMGTLGVIEAVLITQRIVVTAGWSKSRRCTVSNGVNVNAVQPGREALHVNVKMNDACRILNKLSPANNLATGIDQDCGGMLSAGCLGIHARDWEYHSERGY